MSTKMNQNLRIKFGPQGGNLTPKYLLRFYSLKVTKEALPSKRSDQFQIFNENFPRNSKEEKLFARLFFADSQPKFCQHLIILEKIQGNPLQKTLFKITSSRDYHGKISFSLYSASPPPSKILFKIIILFNRV